MFMYDWRTLTNANRTYFKAIHRRSARVNDPTQRMWVQNKSIYIS